MYNRNRAENQFRNPHAACLLYKLCRAGSHVLLVISALILTGSGFVSAQTRVDMPVFEGGAGLDFFLECARIYEAENPGVAIDLYGDPRIVDKIRVRVLEGSYPDVTNAGLNYWPLIRNGTVKPLDEYLDQPNWEGDMTWRESFLPGSLEAFQYEGKVYALPFMYSVYAVWYNKAMFEEQGWDIPITWDEFFALCDMMRASNVWPLAFQGRYPNYAQSVIEHAYYHLAGPDGFSAMKLLEPGSFDNPELRESFEIMQRISLNYFQPGAMGMSHTESQLEFFLGHTAMIFCGSWLKSEMLGKIPDGFRLGTFNLPHSPTGKAPSTAIQAGSGYYFVMADGQNPEAGVNFLRFMTSRRMSGLFTRQRDIPVAIKGVADQNLSEDLQDLATMVRSAETSYGATPGEEQFPDMGQYWNDARYGVLTGESTPTQAAAALEAAAVTVRNLAADPDGVTYRHFWKPLFLLGLIGAAFVYWSGSSVKRLRRGKDQTSPVSSVGRMHLSWTNRIVLLGPALALYTVFVIVPSLKSFSWSAHAWDGLTEMRYIGLLNFVRLLFESDGFWVALGNNLFIMFVIPAFVLPLSLFLAVCISREVYGSGFFRIMFFFPNILGAVAATLLWMHLYNPQGGPVNAALVSIGELLTVLGLVTAGAWFESWQGFAWLSQSNLYQALIPMSIWGACGFNMILFLAAMESIPQSMYEAAEIDGASAWRQFVSITLPLMWEILSISIVFMVIGGMKAFEGIWLLTNQAPTTQVHVIGTRMVQSMFTEFKVGEATAVAVLLFIMVFLGTAATLRVMRRERVEF